MNADTGLVVRGSSLYITRNGCQTWSYIGDAYFVGQTNSGSVVYGRTPGIFQPTTLWVSNDRAQTFQPLPGSHDTYSVGQVKGDLVLLWGDGHGEGIDPSTNTSHYLGYTETLDAEIKDMYFEGTCGSMVGLNGNIQNRCLGGDGGPAYSWSDNDYWAIDGIPGGAWYGVGDNTIVTNRDIGNGAKWNEVFDEHAEAIKGSFRSIVVISPTLLYIGGTNGTFLKCRA